MLNPTDPSLRVSREANLMTTTNTTRKTTTTRKTKETPCARDSQVEPKLLEHTLYLVSVADSMVLNQIPSYQWETN